MENLTYRCGCINRIHPHYGVQESVQKCVKHITAKLCQPTGRPYYESMCCIENGIPQAVRYTKEFIDGFGRLQDPISNLGRALMVGCGIGLYTAHLCHLGYWVFGIDKDPWAVEYCNRAYPYPFQTCYEGTYDEVQRSLPSSYFDLIVAAHVLEHMEDFYATLLSFKRLLVKGGQLAILVPDNEDPVNPDHKWFFTELSLRQNLLNLHYYDIQTKVRRRIEREQFIYCRCLNNK